jgi:hypothetical protein
VGVHGSVIYTQLPVHDRAETQVALRLDSSRWGDEQTPPYLKDAP